MLQLLLASAIAVAKANANATVVAVALECCDDVAQHPVAHRPRAKQRKQLTPRMQQYTHTKHT
eukprot:326065-Alexandrium_andersonii.AAC.1